MPWGLKKTVSTIFDCFVITMLSLTTETSVFHWDECLCFRVISINTCLISCFHEFRINISMFQHIRCNLQIVFFLLISENSQNKFFWYMLHVRIISSNLLYWPKWNSHFTHNLFVTQLSFITNLCTFLIVSRFLLSEGLQNICHFHNWDSAIFEIMIPLNLWLHFHKPFYYFNCFWLHVIRFYTEFDADSLLNTSYHFK